MSRTTTAPQDDPEALQRRRELVGRRVLQLRLRLGWKQQDLVAHAGVSANTVHCLEHGTARTHWTSLQKVARALQTTAELLTADLENDLALAWLHPELRDLDAEDFRIAHLFHRATPPTREYITYLLLQDQSPHPIPLHAEAVALHVGARFAQLSANAQEAIAIVLRQIEQADQQRHQPPHTSLPSAV